jgi:hypothetical protein
MALLVEAERSGSPRRGGPNAYAGGKTVYIARRHARREVCGTYLGGREGGRMRYGMQAERRVGTHWTKGAPNKMITACNASAVYPVKTHAFQMSCVRG